MLTQVCCLLEDDGVPQSKPVPSTGLSEAIKGISSLAHPPGAQRRYPVAMFLREMADFGNVLQWKVIVGSQATRSSPLLCLIPRT